MLGAIYIGLSGMDAYSKGLQTISNNVANLNTSGFKSTSATFTDLFSYGGGGLTYSGGSLGSSHGDGVSIGAPLVNFAQGDLRQTNNDLDLAIQGSGFLMLLNDDKTYYMRTGSFVVDKDGYISEQQTGHHLGVLDSNGRVVAVNLDSQRTNPPQATTKVVFADNLSSTGTDAVVSDIAVYDSRGGKQVWTVNFVRSQTTPGQWDVTVKDSSGRIVGTSMLNFVGSTVDPATSMLTITDAPEGADSISVTLDFSNGVTSYSAGTSSTLRAASVDGHGVGALTTVTVDPDGQIKLTYSNAQTKLIGAVAIADFRDPQQLEQVGNGLYSDKGGVGEKRVLASGIDGIGTLQSKKIEASNVNLSDEFGALILIQRGFQASSQVVSISNDMIQQLFGIRGQG